MSKFAFEPQVERGKVYTNTWYGRGTAPTREEAHRRVEAAATKALKHFGGKAAVDQDEDAFFRKPHKGEAGSHVFSDVAGAHKAWHEAYGKYGEYE